jgi:RHS repeat-associated protein
VDLTNQQGTAINEYAYLPFGELARSSQLIANRFQFIGEFGVTSNPDGQTTFMRERSYFVGLGRFSSIDGLQISNGRLNYYNYVSNNPNSFVDVTGLEPLDPRLEPFVTQPTPQQIALEPQHDFIINDAIPAVSIAYGTAIAVPIAAEVIPATLESSPPWAQSFTANLTAKADRYRKISILIINGASTFADYLVDNIDINKFLPYPFPKIETNPADL